MTVTLDSCDVFWHYQIAAYGWAIHGAPGFDFTTALCETPDAFMVRLYQDVY